jgi:integrase
MAQGRGSIKKRLLDGGRVRWDVIVDLGPDPVTHKRRQRKKTFGTKREAQAALADWQVEIGKGLAVDRSRQTVGEYLDYWLEAVAQHRVRPTTFASYGQIVRNRIVPALGTVPLQQLAPAQVQALYGRLLESGRVDGRGPKLSPRSVRYTHAVLRMALEDAVHLGLVSRNVCDAATPPRAVRPPIKYWDTADAQRFLDVTREDHLRALWVLALHTGLRRGELLGLRWGDVDLDRAVLHVRRSLVQSGGVMGFQEPKTSSGRRTIALDPPCVAALREQRARQAEHRLRMGSLWQDHDQVFATELGTPLEPSNVDRRFRALLARAGVPRIPFHGLRHTHATLLMKHGVHPKVASERLGHANITLTLSTYSHVLPQMQEEAAAIFAAALARKAGGERL